MPGSDLALLSAAALSAGTIARSYVGQNPQVWDKSGGAGPVTEADLAVNAHLHAVLRAERPNYGWLSEETEDDAARLRALQVFVVDPIDGTRAFIEGSRDWSHSLAITTNGLVTAAAIYLPMRDQLFTAAKGEGAFLNDEPIKASDLAAMDRAHILSTKPNLNPEYWKDGITPAFRRGFRSSLAYRMALVAQGQFDAMLTLRPTWEWDVAAGTLIVAEAGGTVTNRKGHAPRFNNPHPQIDGLVAGGAVHSAILDQLA